jgi:Skp family chaperone for outer membrane proteins
MKAPIKSLIIASLALASAIGLHAQSPAPKVAFCDVETIFAKYYQTVETSNKLYHEKLSAADHARQLQAEGQEIIGRLKAANEKAGKIELAADVRAQAQKDTQDLYQQVNDKQVALNKFIADVQQQLGKEFTDYKNIALNLINDSATKIAKSHNANLLIDRSKSTTYQTTVFIYIDPGYLDITQEVVDEMNRNHEVPVDEAAAAAASAATAPAASPSIPAIK